MNRHPRLDTLHTQDPTLQELFLSYTGIDGIVPDVIPPGSPLRIFYAISRLGDDRTPTGAGLSGASESKRDYATGWRTGGWIIPPSH